MYYGFDIGGTKLRSARLITISNCSGKPAFPPRESYDEFLTAIAALVAQADERFGVKGSVGIGIRACLKPTTARCMPPTSLLPAANRCAPISLLSLSATCV